jgi:MFS family permease
LIKARIGAVAGVQWIFAGAEIRSNAIITERSTTNERRDGDGVRSLEKGSVSSWASTGVATIAGFAVLGPILGGVAAQYAGLRAPYFLCIAVLAAAIGAQYLLLKKPVMGHHEVKVSCLAARVAPPVSNSSLRYFGERLGVPHLFQIHLEGKDGFLDGKVRVMPTDRFLAEFSQKKRTPHIVLA